MVRDHHCHPGGGKEDEMIWEISRDSPRQQKNEWGSDEDVPGAVHVRVVERRLRETVQAQRNLVIIWSIIWYPMTIVQPKTIINPLMG